MTVRAVLASVAIGAAIFAIASSAPRQSKDSSQEPKKTAGGEAAQLKVITNQEAFAFPNPWPAPLEVPNTDPEEAALYLAQKVLAGGPEALPALERAALLSGYSIHSSDGKILYSPDKDCDVGLSMLDLDLAVATDLTSRQMPGTVNDLQTQLRAKLGLGDFPVADLFSKTMISWFGSFHPGKYFFGNFVRALSDRADSNNYADFDGLEPENELCAAQITFLLYAAYGMTAVADQTRNGLPPGVKEDVRKAPGEEKENPPTAPGVEPAEAPPADGVPPAADPPPARSHGPYVQTQLTSTGQTLANLQQAMSEFVSSDWTEYVRDHTQPGINPQRTILQFLRNQLYRTGIQARFGGMTPSPLVRTKKHGQKGGTADFSLSVDLFIPPDIRQKYAAAMQELPGSPALAPDGPLDVLLSTKSYDPDAGDDQCLENPEWNKSGPGKYNITLTGAVQNKNLRDQVVEVPRWPDVTFGFQPKAAPECPQVFVTAQVPVTDWRNAGIYLDFQISVEGNGTYTTDKGNYQCIWSISRMLCKSSLLDLDLPGGGLFGTNIPPPIERMKYTLWQKNPSKPAEQDFEYDYRDNYIFLNKMRAIGCGTVDDRKKKYSTFRRYADRKEPMPRDINLDMVQTHKIATGEDYALNSSFWKVPVTITSSDAAPLQDHRSVFDGLEDIKPNPPYGSVDREGLIQLMGIKKSGSFDMTGRISFLTGGTGKNTVKIHVFWIIGPHYPSGSRNPPKNNPPPPPPPPGSPLSLRAKTFHGGIRLADLNGTNKNRRKTELWVDNNSAATCSEIILSDSPPPAARKKPKK